MWLVPRRNWLLYVYFYTEIKKKVDFPDGPVDTNPPANAGDMGWSLLWEGPACHRHRTHALEPALYNKRSHHNEKMAGSNEDPE